jgi:alpha-D-ribose 1-methylphosphonate 5-triphosphate diphosphatase
MTIGLIIENAKVVLADRVINGWVAVSGQHIAEVGERRAPKSGIGFAGNILAPGLVELHTDHLESHLKPRPKVRWPAGPAVVAYDAQMVASGITTVFDSLRVRNDADNDTSVDELWGAADAIDAARQRGLLRADHRTHLRCEICADDVVEQTRRPMERHRVDLLSLMDHMSGARQFRDIGAWKTYYGGKSELRGDELDRFMDKKRELFTSNYTRHRAALVKLAKVRGVAIASHDDTTLAHAAESIADGVAIAEFPTTAEAASASHTAGVAVLMVAPNVVRGSSHSGNVAAEILARDGVLDILSSDYVPASLLMGAFALSRSIDGLGLRADLIRIHLAQDMPVVREVYNAGQRVL